MQLDVYQTLRAVQALCASLGIWLSVTNLHEAYLDQRFLMDRGTDGIHGITAISLVVRSSSRAISFITI